MTFTEKQTVLRSWLKERRPIRTFLGNLVTLLTLGWDFPLLEWWRSRPRVQARIQRRRGALRYFLKLARFSIRLTLRLSIKVATLGRYPKRPFMWDREN